MSRDALAHPFSFTYSLSHCALWRASRRGDATRAGTQPVFLERAGASRSTRAATHTALRAKSHDQPKIYPNQPHAPFERSHRSSARIVLASYGSAASVAPQREVHLRSCVPSIHTAGNGLRRPNLTGSQAAQADMPRHSTQRACWDATEDIHCSLKRSPQKSALTETCALVGLSAALGGEPARPKDRFDGASDRSLGDASVLIDRVTVDETEDVADVVERRLAAKVLGTVRKRANLLVAHSRAQHECTHRAVLLQARDDLGTPLPGYRRT